MKGEEGNSHADLTMIVRPYLGHPGWKRRFQAFANRTAFVHPNILPGSPQSSRRRSLIDPCQKIITTDI